LTSAAPAFAVGGSALLLGGICLLRRQRSSQHRRLVLASLAVAVWMIGSALARAATSEAAALLWAGIGLAGASALPSALLWLAASTAPPRRGRRRLLLVGFGFSLASAGAALGGALVEGVRPAAWGLQPSYSPLAMPLALFGLALWLAALGEARRSAEAAPPGRRSQARRLGLALGVAGLAAVDLAPGLGLAVYPLGFVPLAVFLAVAASALGGGSHAVSDDAAHRILGTLADGLIVCDAAGRVEHVNDALCALSGFERRTLLGVPMVSLFSGSGQETFAGRRWRELTVTEELSRLHGVSGEELEVSVSVSQLRGDDGELRGAVVLVRDIRETRRSQLMLVESERRLAEAQRLARCGDWSWKVGAEQVAGSEELLRGFGLEPGSVVSWRRLYRRLSRDDRRTLRRSVEQALLDGGRFQLEARLSLPDGRERSVHLECECHHGREGEPAELRGTVQDVSEARQAERAMRALNKAVETTQVGITIADPEGRILYANPADAHLHGYEVAELLGADVGVLAPPELRRPLPPGELRELRARRRETLNRHKDGRVFPVELTSDVLVDAAGAPEAVVTSCLDITERK
jgi:PAS domain S-box-containing protein